MVKLRSVVVFIFVSYWLLQPILPYIEYYTFRQYIIKNLCVNRNNPKNCCQGKCYLEKKVKEANKTEDKDTKAPLIKKTETFPYIIPTRINFGNHYIQTANHSLFINIIYGFLFKNTIFRPPKYFF
jgi:hypothetical protein